MTAALEGGEWSAARPGHTLPIIQEAGWAPGPLTSPPGFDPGPSSPSVIRSSTSHAQRCLTAVIGREPVFSTWYGRWHYLAVGKEKSQGLKPIIGHNLEPIPPILPFSQKPLEHRTMKTTTNVTVA